MTRPEHAEAMRAWHRANPQAGRAAAAAMRAARRRGLDGLTEEELREYQRLRTKQKNHGFSLTRAERLRLIGRSDLALVAERSQ